MNSEEGEVRGLVVSSGAIGLGVCLAGSGVGVDVEVGVADGVVAVVAVVDGRGGTGGRVCSLCATTAATEPWITTARRSGELVVLPETAPQSSDE